MKTRIIFFFLIIVASCIQAQVRMVAGQSVLFEKQDVIDLATYNWPRTLISYVVVFDGGVKEEMLSLTDKSQGVPVPFQLSEKVVKNGFLQRARVSFFAALPQGGKYAYELVATGRKPVTVDNPLAVVSEDGQFSIGNKDMTVYIPASQSVKAGKAPASVLSVQKGDRKIGNNRLYAHRKNVERIETLPVEVGELFVKYQMKYYLAGNATYTAWIKVVQGYPFVILEEEMNGLSKEDRVYLDMCWDNFAPVKRFGTQWDRVFDKASQWIGIDTPVHTSYSQEDPHWTGMGWIEDPSKEMIFRISPFGGNSVREQPPVMSFWEEGKNADELGVFVYDHQKWDDRQYGIWQPTPDLSIYFRYDDNKLYFKYPLVDGSRSTAIAFFSEEQGRKAVAGFNKRIDEIAKAGGAHKSEFLSYRYTQMLHQQYASLSLDRIKDWELEYANDKKQPENLFTKDHTGQTAESFYQNMISSAFAYYPMGLNFYPGIHSIEHRPVYSKLVEGYLFHARSLTEKQRKTVNALFILGGYVNMLEEMNAIRNSLAGTANMAADGWCVPMQTAYLFPEHPMAKEWGDFFEKCLEIYGVFYTRPEVRPFEGKGGRWVESLGVYNWAYLRPTGHSNIAGELYDGKNRFASSYMAERGKWLVDMLTAPVYNYRNVEGAQPGYPEGWRPGDALDEKSFTRQYPAHGAHGGGTTVDRPSSLFELGEWLFNYDPIVAENIFWAGTFGKELEHKLKDSDWAEVYKRIHTVDNRGTNPHLKSCKYVGHGIVLRAGVDTPEELSIHLEQVDKGPNYRWGNQAQGNSGGIYFYAQGQIFTGHENENAGDHITNNLDGVTNFGVMKNGEFRTIGMNELTAPLYDLGVAQFAELLPATGKDLYSWPEYQSRSILLVGTDYYLIFDETGTNWRAAHRFSWFTGKGFEYPQITFLSKKARDDHWTVAETATSRGFYRDAFGSLLTLVSHKKGEVVPLRGKLKNIPLLGTEEVADFIPAKEGAYPEGVIGIRAPQSEDLVFRAGKTLEYRTEQEDFEGKAGVIRRMKDGSLQLALIRGTKIAADGLGLSMEAGDEAAIALTRAVDETLFGTFKALKVTKVTLTGVTPKGTFYIDGVAQPVRVKAGQAVLTLPAGQHSLEYTAGKAMPLPAEITDVEYEKNHFLIYWQNPNRLKSVRLEVSVDGGKHWETVTTTLHSPYKLSKDGYKDKIHIRAVAMNGKRAASSAKEYPVYVTGEAPHYPEGIWMKLDDNRVEISWGKVLGVQKYRLYRRVKGEQEFRLIYEGKANCFVDKTAAGVCKAFAMPGSLDNRLQDRHGLKVYEYAVASVNGNGEGALSPVENTDPASWKNWYPAVTLKFKRQSAFWMPPYMSANMSPEKYYPD